MKALISLGASMLLAVMISCGSSGGSDPVRPPAPVAPSITTQPQASQAVTAGASVSFTVVAAGTAPLRYQWRKEGVAIGGATLATYSISSAVVGDSGTYTVAVSNGTAPDAISQNAVLTVTTVPAAPVISYPSTSYTFFMGAAIAPVIPTNTGGAATAWSLSPDLPAGLVFDAGSGRITGTPTAISAATDYEVTAINASGSATAALSIAVSADGHRHYVRKGAAGAGTGANWTDAYDELPAQLIRGDVYYLASGAYGGYTFDDAVSGGSWIEVKKATASDHGTDTGWSGAYAAGQATFPSLTIQVGYLSIDGVTGGGPNSFEAGHGIKVHSASNVDRIAIQGENADGHLDHIRIQHVEIEGIGWGATGAGDEGIQATASVATRGACFVRVSHCYFHDFSEGGQPLQSTLASDWTVEYCKFARNASAAAHSELWQSWGGDRLTVRHNLIEDIEGSAILYMSQHLDQIEGVYPTYTRTGIELYGNIIHFKSLVATKMLSMGLIGIGGTAVNPFSNCKIYNNTICNMSGLNTGLNLNSAGSYSGVEVRNNLWVECLYTDLSTYSVILPDNAGITRSHNGFYRSRRTSSTSLLATETDLTVNPFVDSAQYDFHLLAPTAPGYNLPAPYDVDMFGRKRAPGAVDRGALVYVPAGAAQRDEVPAS